MNNNKNFVKRVYDLIFNLKFLRIDEKVLEIFKFKTNNAATLMKMNHNAMFSWISRIFSFSNYKN
ncbi:MAG: hypothetical protein ACFFFB_08615 [Candidatus Heimdallarchaeota archaeon]